MPPPLSRAIPIVAPSDAQSSPKPTPALRTAIPAAAATASSPSTPKGSPRLTAKAPTFKPTTPAFVPSTPTSPAPALTPNAAAFVPRSAQASPAVQGQQELEPQWVGEEEAGWAAGAGVGVGVGPEGVVEGFEEMSMHDPSAYPPDPSQHDAYYLPPPTFHQQPLQYHLYVPPAPPHSSAYPSQPTLQNFFIPPLLHQTLTERHEATLRSPPPGLRLPEQVHVYRELYPLDDGSGPGRGVGGWPSWAYRATSERDGGRWCLRRVEGFRLQSQEPLSAVDKWRRIRHPSIVHLHEAFSTRAFSDASLILVYAFHPLSTPLANLHLPTPANPSPPPIPERLLWSYVFQLAGALQAVHHAGLAVRGLDAGRVLVTGKNRLRINLCGAMDVIAFDNFANVHAQQQDDLLSLGSLLLSLALNNPAAPQTLPKAIEYLARQYSPDLKNTVLYLLAKPSASKSVDEVWRVAGGARAAEELASAMGSADRLEAELGRELENGRLVRLMCKFGFVNERAEFDHDPRWSETGDRYIVKLFRDYVFHQVDEQGNPVLDMSHVLVCLNKLDAGVDEKMMLVSRDEQSCLVVSYREVKNCIEAAYGDLARANR